MWINILPITTSQSIISKMTFLEHAQGSHGQTALGDGVVPPSLYELLMHERMGASLRPGLEYEVLAICDTYPSVSQWLPFRQLVESVAVVQFAIQRYFLQRYDALSTEKFYGMKRVRLHTANASDGTTTSPLTAHERRHSLLFAVRMMYQMADNYCVGRTEEMDKRSMCA